MNRATLLALAACCTAVVIAQTGAPSVSAEARNHYNRVKANLIAAAEKMPEDAYNFKPTDGQQTFAERILHVANQYRSCNAISGQKKAVATAKKDKAGIVEALKQSFAACDAAWEGMNEKTAAETIAGRGGQQTTKLGTLVGNTNHDSEMYGYISVYMRLKNVIPPSSDRK